MKKKLMKMMDWVCSNIYWIVLIIFFSIGFFNLFIASIILLIVFIVSLGYLIYTHTKQDGKTQEKTEQLKSNINKDFSQYACLLEDGSEHVLSIYFDKSNNLYRINDDSTLEIYPNLFYTKEGAKEYIQKISKKIVGLNVINCVKVFEK